jgi:hypothetical protein
MKSKRWRCAVAALTFTVFAGCHELNSSDSSERFDAQMIANEADNGNLEPLKALNAACASEVKKTGARSASCQTQDQVGSLRKPLRLGN